MNNINIICLTLAGLAFSACTTIESSESLASESPVEMQWVYQSDLPISAPPFREVHCNWKDRIDQRYAYLEHIGPSRLPDHHRLPVHGRGGAGG